MQNKPKGKWAGDNPLAAQIILADIEKHGGEKSLAVQWARLWSKNNGTTRTS